jgi:hypothetical protein
MCLKYRNLKNLKDCTLKDFCAKFRRFSGSGKVTYLSVSLTLIPALTLNQTLNLALTLP